MINQLINHVTVNKAQLTFQISNVKYIYKILSKDKGLYGVEEANKKFKQYLYEARARNSFQTNFDEKSVNVFARIIYQGDNVEYLFTDSSGKIYYVNMDSYWKPKIISDDIIDIIGDIDIKELDVNDFHFEFPHPIIRIKDIVDYNRVVEIYPHGFYIDQYENLLRELFLNNAIDLRFEYFKYESNDWNNKLKTHYGTEIRINNQVFNMKLEKGKWFDFSLAKKLNKILEDLNLSKTIQILHEEDWDEKHAICLLSEKEYQLLQENRIVVAVED